jgi:hypothetical protein
LGFDLVIAGRTVEPARTASVLLAQEADPAEPIIERWPGALTVRVAKPRNEPWTSAEAGCSWQPNTEEQRVATDIEFSADSRRA